MLLFLASCASNVDIIQGGACHAERVAEAPITLVANHPALPVLINRTAVVLLLDTGSERTILTEAAAARLGLPPSSDVGPVMHGVTGTAQHKDVLVREVRLGAVELGHPASGPVTVGVLAKSALNARSFDGVLGADLLSPYDLELDLDGGRMALWEVSGCTGGFLAWGGGTQRMGIALAHGNLAFLPAYVDGRPLVALLDTGADRTLISMRAAAKIGVTPAELARDPGGTGFGVGDGKLGIHLHRFASLQVGPELARNPQLVVAELPPLPLDMLLGVDFLRAHRVWLSYSTSQVFFAPQPWLNAGGS